MRLLHVLVVLALSFTLAVSAGCGASGGGSSELVGIWVSEELGDAYEFKSDGTYLYYPDGVEGERSHENTWSDEGEGIAKVQEDDMEWTWNYTIEDDTLTAKNDLGGTIILKKQN